MRNRFLASGKAHTQRFITTLAIAALSAASFIVPAASAEFKDLKADHPNAEAVNYVQAQKIVKGYEDGTYKPDAAINRAEFTKIVLLAYFNEDEVKKCTIVPKSLSDVPASEWFAPYICFAHKNKIIKGYEDGTFRPNQKIAFTEAAKIISNTRIVKELGTITEEPQSKPWFRVYIGALEEGKAIPTSIQKFGQEVTRGEMAEMIFRIRTKNTDKKSQTFDQLAKNEKTTEPVSKHPGINDLDIGFEVAGMKVVRISKAITGSQPIGRHNISIEFTGKATIKGKYKTLDGPFFEGSVCLTDLEEVSTRALPQIKEIKAERKNTLICFDNVTVKDKPFKGLEGTATIQIDKYNLKNAKTTITDTAELVKVLEDQPTKEFKAATEVNFTKVNFKKYDSKYKGFDIIKNETELYNFRKKLLAADANNSLALADYSLDQKVDFEKNILVVASHGVHEKKTMNWSLKKVVNENFSVNVHIERNVPGKNCVYTLKYEPVASYSAAIIPVQDKSIEFVIDETVTDCPAR